MIADESAPTSEGIPLAKKPEYLLILLAVASSLAFCVWQALLNNFAIEQAAFTGREIGILQSLREIPGFLAFLPRYLSCSYCVNSCLHCLPLHCWAVAWR